MFRNQPAPAVHDISSWPNELLAFWILDFSTNLRYRNVVENTGRFGPIFTASRHDKFCAETCMMAFISQHEFLNCILFTIAMGIEDGYVPLTNICGKKKHRKGKTFSKGNSQCNTKNSKDIWTCAVPMPHNWKLVISSLKCVDCLVGPSDKLKRVMTSLCVPVDTKRNKPRKQIALPG